jgi:ribosomal protein S18 acetylase RimI-like enzyme
MDASKSNPMIVEAATEADATAIGIVHTLSWHETYRGIVPDAVLASLDPKERAATWGRVIAKQGGLFVLRDGARVVGFGGAGANRDSSLPHAGMFNTLYILSHAQHQGHGRRLMSAMAAHLKAAGRDDAVLWVAAQNMPACGFYESLGGQVVGRATELHEAWQLPCVAYGWDDLTRLIQHGA